MDTFTSSQKETGSEKTILILQACEILKVSRRTVYNWIKKGLLKTKKSGATTRIYLSSIVSDGVVLLERDKRGPKSKKYLNNN